MFLGKYFPPSMVTKLRNEISNFRQRPDESLFEAWERYRLSIDRCPNHNMLLVTQIDTFHNGLTLRHRDTINAAAGGTFMKRPTVGQTQNVYAAGAYNQGVNSYQPQGELTLRVGKEAVTFNLDQTSRYSANYDAMLVNQIDLIDVAFEEYSQEVLGFSMSGNPTPSTKSIVSNSSPTLTPFEDSDFLLEETDAFLAIDDELISPEIDEA
nr:reverse transcriptase domain-containing protein [Tanacetum cinerariifolium]GEW68326.1 reverse transcriptase domain-containing protein [Tanacetum cinerariifolium]